MDSTVGIEEKRVSGIAQVKFDEIMKCSKGIIDMLESRDEEVLENEHDEIIRKYMRELQDMKDDVRKCLAKVEELRELTVIYKFTCGQKFCIKCSC